MQEADGKTQQNNTTNKQINKSRCVAIVFWNNKLKEDFRQVGVSSISSFILYQVHNPFIFTFDIKKRTSWNKTK